MHKCKKLPERGGGLQLLNHLALRCRVTLSGVGTVERSLQANLGGELLLLGKAFSSENGANGGLFECELL